MDENNLKEKLRRIEALFAGAATHGERDAAGAARERILLRLKEMQDHDPATEWKFTLHDSWDAKVFCALCRRYNLHPYRYPRQRRTTVMVRVPKSFVDRTLWPEFTELSQGLRQYLTEVTDRLISTEIHKDTSEAEEVPDQRTLEHVAPSTPSPPSPPTSPNPDPSPPPSPAASAAPAGPPPPKVSRNAPCPCGSKRKFKKCCGRTAA